MLKLPGVITPSIFLLTAGKRLSGLPGFGKYLIMIHPLVRNDGK